MKPQNTRNTRKKNPLRRMYFNLTNGILKTSAILILSKEGKNADLLAHEVLDSLAEPEAPQPAGRRPAPHNENCCQNLIQPLLSAYSACSAVNPTAVSKPRNWNFKKHQ